MNWLAQQNSSHVPEKDTTTRQKREGIRRIEETENGAEAEPRVAIQSGLEVNDLVEQPTTAWENQWEWLLTGIQMFLSPSYLSTQKIQTQPHGRREDLALPEICIKPHRVIRGLKYKNKSS